MSEIRRAQFGVLQNTVTRLDNRVLTRSSLRYAVSLNAPTALTTFTGDATTYLNRGQTYSLRIVDTANLAPGASYRTSIGISFQDDHHRKDKQTCWKTWNEIRGSQLSQSQSKIFQAVEFIDAAKVGFTNSSSLSPQCELVETFLDGFAVCWTPTSTANHEFVIALRFNFVSADFTLLRGGNKVAVRLCVKTEAWPPSSLHSTSDMGEICYSNFQLLREHGAARKQSDDLSRALKRVDEMERKLAALDLRLESPSNASKASEVRPDAGKDVDSCKSQAAFRGLQVSKLQSLLACSQSSEPSTRFNMRGDHFDDPDVRPLRSGQANPMEAVSISRAHSAVELTPPHG